MSRDFPTVNFKILRFTRLLNADSMTKGKGDNAASDGAAIGDEGERPQMAASDMAARGGGGKQQAGGQTTLAGEQGLDEELPQQNPKPEERQGGLVGLAEAGSSCEEDNTEGGRGGGQR
jgi:hypothetical protein